MRMILIRNSAYRRRSAKAMCKTDCRADHTTRECKSQVFFSDLGKLIPNKKSTWTPCPTLVLYRTNAKLSRTFFSIRKARPAPKCKSEVQNQHVACAEVQKRSAKSTCCARRPHGIPLGILYHARMWKVKNYFKVFLRNLRNFIDFRGLAQIFRDFCRFGQNNS